MQHTASIVIAGTGSIGCYIGGCLALAGRDVTFLARPKIAEALKLQGLRVSDLEGRDRALDPGSLKISGSPEQALASANIVLVTVKSGDTEQMANLIDRHAPAGATTISLQNGVDNADRIRSVMKQPGKVLAGMVAFNVVLSDGPPVRAHRATDGDILVEQVIPGLADMLDVEGLAVKPSSDMKAVQWGKLLLNLNNALNALSDRPLAEELSDRRWRRLLAAQMDEALAAMRAVGIKPANLAGAPPALLPSILRLPNWLFGFIARRMLAIDPQARSSMWEDLSRRRPTEIDELQGAIVRLADTAGTKVPLNRRVAELIRAAQSENAGPPRLEPDQVARL